MKEKGISSIPDGVLDESDDFVARAKKLLEEKMISWSDMPKRHVVEATVKYLAGT